MLPVKIAILWHQHQPYYKNNGEFLLPWVRLHGVKDYFDLPELLHEFPDIKQTFNMVPSLMKQIDMFINMGTSDKIQRLTRKAPHLLTREEKFEILRLFFLCNTENMIIPYERYKEIFDEAQIPEIAVNNFSEQDWRDIQVWYNLTWVGQFSRERKGIRRLFDKERNFTEEEKIFLLEMHNDILAQINPELRNLKNMGQVEISCSPFYHPILPLLCNSKSALEALPSIPLPEPVFTYPQDAEDQIRNAINYCKNIFGESPNGMWPSEGSISDEALDLMIKSGIKWTASDEQILANTFGDGYSPLEKYFPRKFATDSGSIAVLFRDHLLSDAIGFVYSRWNPVDAANDFCYRLNYIKNELVKNYGEDCLEHAVIPVILDGENCWEFYRNNGIDFLRNLYERLSYSDDFRTVTCSEAVAPQHLNEFEELEHIRAGSWINANFKIWIGHPEDIAAWNLLSAVRMEVERAKDKIDEDTYKKAMEEIYIAEGSDWFWWYGDEHVAENKNDFDVLFRMHIGEVYKILGLEPPEAVYEPISDYGAKYTLVNQSGLCSPSIDGKLTSAEEWENAGYYDAHSSMGAMHQIGELIRKIWFASDFDMIYFRCDTIHDLGEDDCISFDFISPANIHVIIRKFGIEFESDKQLLIDKFQYASVELIEFSLPRKAFFIDYDEDIKYPVELSISTSTKEGEMTYPRQGSLEILL